MSVPDNTPFFIVGAPRSGTTLLRTILRLHPRLECPEETHFFRWPDPFGTDHYERICCGLKFLQEHRTLDGIGGDAFDAAVRESNNRKDLAEWYGTRYLRERNNDDGRWFDKTPQNVYGILLIAETWPTAKFVHIHRHPLNVIASLRTGAVMKSHNLRAAINSWLEPIMILQQFRTLAPSRLHDLPYEGLTSSPRTVITSLLGYLGESVATMPFERVSVHEARNNYTEILSEAEISEALRRTEKYRARFNYD